MDPVVAPPPGSYPDAPPPAPWTRVDPGIQPHLFAPPYAPPPRTNVLAIVAFAGSFFFGVIGIVCGHIALAQIRRTAENGRGLALAGLIIGYVQTGFVVLWMIFTVVVIVIAGVAPSSAALSDTTRAASPASDCAVLEKASLALSSTLTDIAASDWRSAPAAAAAKAKVIAALSTFSESTQTVSDDTLTQGIASEQDNLDLLSSALVNYQAAAGPGAGDESKVTAALTRASDDLVRLTSGCS